MGKIVKFCSKCDESFASKFSFCPNCAESLEAFEMNPVNENKTEEINNVGKLANTKKVVIQKQAFLQSEGNNLKTKTIADVSKNDDILELDVEGNGSVGKIEKPSLDTNFRADSKDEEVETIVSKTPAKYNDNLIPPKYADTPDHAYDYKTFTDSGNDFKTVSDNFHVTVLQEKNVKERNMLLFGATALMLTMVFGGFLYSLFAKDLNLAAVDSDSYGVMVPNVDDPMIDEDEPPKPKDDNEGGGGGGGGNKNPKPVSKGQIATQFEKPLIAPTVTLEKRDFDLKYQGATQGIRKKEQTNEKYGNPNSSSFDYSDGPGSDGGQGTGMNRGQGPGDGPGLGPGSNGGAGGGNNGGDGPGNGPGSGRPRTVPPKKDNDEKAGGVSSPFKLLSKPRPSYTDEARKNNIKGTVRVKVQFLANGQIGSVTPINSLGYGLTEKAIAAARSIQFEPPKRNGVAQTTVKVIDFNFTIY